MRYIKKFNELNTTTYLSAANKARNLNQRKRAASLINHAFSKFYDLEINNMSINRIQWFDVIGNLEMQKKAAVEDQNFELADEIKKSINQNKEYDKLLTILFKDTVICYNPTNDQLTHHSYKMVGNNPNIDLNKKLKFTLINRKSANNLSKIIKSVNPNSKYSNPNNMDIETY
jgi:hypothetical protein